MLTPLVFVNILPHDCRAKVYHLRQMPSPDDAKVSRAET
jgi:hypothetical protein